MLEQASDRTIGRLSIYRRLLSERLAEKKEHIYSHELSKATGASAAQVRRDLMVVGYNGSPTKGYEVVELIRSIGSFLDGSGSEGVAIVGLGNLGRAILTYFAGRRPNLAIVAVFDNDPHKTGRVIQGCRCYAMSDLDGTVRKAGIATAILAVPANEAQKVAEALVRAGIKGILNFAPCHLRLPKGVYMTNMDFTASLEKVAFFARRIEVN